MRRVPKHTKALCITLFTLLSLASLSIRLMAAESSTLATFSEVWVFALVALPLGYWALLKKERALCQPSLWLLAALFAGIITLAQSFSIAGTTELLTQSMATKIKACLYFLGRIPLYYMALSLVRGLLVRDTLFVSTAEKSGASRLRSFANQRECLLAFTLLLLVCWLPYYLCTFPGTVSNDSITQLREIYQIKPLSAGNPIAQTFLLWGFCWLGERLGGPNVAIALYCALQALLMATLLAYTVRFMLRAGTPSWLSALTLGFFALCPVFPVFAFCVGKDTNFAMAVLYFSLMGWQILRQPKAEPLPRRFVIGLCLSTALVTLLRNPGLYLALLTLCLLLLWTLGKERRASAGRPWAPVLCAFLALGITCAGLHLAILPSMSVEPMPETEEYSIPLQQVARVAATQALTPQEEEALSGVWDISRIKAEYNGELSDPIKDLWNAEASQEQKNAFFQAWLSLLRKHPGTCFSATFHNTYGYLTPGYVSAIKPTLLIGKQGRTTDLDPHFSFSVNPRADILQSAMNALTQHPLARLLIAPGLYGWITLFALAVLLLSREKQWLLAAFPALFALMGCLFSAVNGYFRYALPLYFCAPVLLALCAQALRVSVSQESKE